MQEKQIFIDLETTGLNPNQDRVCQIGVILPNGEEINTLINPEIKIPAQTSEIHGITDEMVKDSPKFVDIADQVIKGLEEAEIFVAYNFTFDFQFLQYELHRTAQYSLRERDFDFIDPYRIFKTQFPHNLSNAYKFYTGEEFTDAHSAIDDIRATKRVLEAQEKRYPELFAKSPAEIQHETIGDTSILGKWFTKEGEGFKFKQGKHRGEKVDPNYHQDYLRWIVKLEDITISERQYLNDIIHSN